MRTQIKSDNLDDGEHVLVPGAAIGVTKNNCLIQLRACRRVAGSQQVTMTKAEELFGRKIQLRSWRCDPGWWVAEGPFWSSEDGATHTGIQDAHRGSGPPIDLS